MNSLNIDGNIPTKIQCPNCKKNTTMTHLKQIEMDTQNYFEDIALKNPDDVITPKMTNNMYKIIIKQTNSKFKKQQINCLIVKFGKHKVGGVFSGSCQTSESILKIYSYYFIDHEKKLGGYTFRIIENMQEFDENGNIEYFSDSLMKKAEDAIKKASELRVLEKYDESIPYYDDALKILPNAEKLFVYSSKGVALRNLKKYDDAIMCYDKALKINPNDHEILFNKGVVFHELKKYTDAIMCYDKSIQHKPDFSRAWNAKGESLKKMGKMNEAYQCFSKINEL
jgi:tetratricopeptide (TPR) repeat protein